MGLFNKILSINKDKQSDKKSFTEINFYKPFQKPNTSVSENKLIITLSLINVIVQ